MTAQGIETSTQVYPLSKGTPCIARKNFTCCGDITEITFNPLPDDKILDWSKSKQIADDILTCFENGK